MPRSSSRFAKRLSSCTEVWLHSGMSTYQYSLPRWSCSDCSGQVETRSWVMHEIPLGAPRFVSSVRGARLRQLARPWSSRQTESILSVCFSRLGNNVSGVLRDIILHHFHVRAAMSTYFFQERLREEWLRVSHQQRVCLAIRVELTNEGRGSARSVDEVPSGPPELSFGISLEVCTSSVSRSLTFGPHSCSPWGMSTREHSISRARPVIPPGSSLGLQMTEILHESVIRCGRLVHVDTDHE